MVTHDVFSHLLSDNLSYAQYLNEHSIKFNDVKRHLMLAEREFKFEIPDHYYRLQLEKSFVGISNFRDLFIKKLPEFADKFLYEQNRRVYVRAELMNDWQLLLSEFPPLLLVSAVIHRNHPLGEENDFSSYLINNILPNTKYTVLPSPHIKQLDSIKNEHRGFFDLHMHVNGALETDTIWQDCLQRTDKIYKASEWQYIHDSKVREQYESITPGMTPYKFKKLFDEAKVLRYEIYNTIISNLSKQNHNSPNGLVIKEEFGINTGIKHPLEYLLGNVKSHVPLECLLYIMVLDYLEKKEDNQEAKKFYCYLLMLGMTNKLLVQQRKCFGFEEFQKYTSNSFREVSELSYMRRFKQMNGNKLDNLCFIEGRFSPKDSIVKNIYLIHGIRNGLEDLQKQQKFSDVNHSELNLIAHFIKVPDRHPNVYIRHKRLRMSIAQKARILCYMRSNKLPMMTYVVGADAAASEFDAPPEVFAPVFRKMRQFGFPHFTFHAGEDFFHLLSGLRAIYEAIQFLDLRKGDRIGHASATGVPVDLWHSNVGDNIYMHKGDYLDDLVFAFHIIRILHNNNLSKKLPQLELKIEELAFEIYNKTYTASSLEAAWLMRGEDPIKLLEKEAEEIHQIYQKCQYDKTRMFLDYHNLYYKKKYEELISVSVFEMFDADELTEMQQMLLSYMHDKEIVIETLPTSNVFIGHHHSFDTYHLGTWLQWMNEGKPMPPIVVGTDDLGVFATNIYNEYSNIFSLLVYNKKMNVTEASRIIDDLAGNAKLYAFN